MYKLLICLIISTTLNVSANENKIIRIGTLGDYPPYCMAEENHNIRQIISPGKDADKFSGLSWDIVRESFQSRGYTIILFIAPWVRTMRSLKEKEVDAIFPTGKNRERLKTLSYSDNSINEAKFLVYMEKGRTFRWNGLKSLKKLRLGMIKGYNFGDRFSRFSFDIIYLKSISHGFKMINRNRIDGFLGYEDNWDFFLKKRKLEEKYRKLPVFDSSYEFLTALKDNSKGPLFISDFDKGFEIIEKNGKLNRIRKRWLKK